MRLMVIGLDGATFDVLDPWLQAGMLPSLQALLARGVRAPLLSTVPPVTAPAWVSCFSGVNPGRHGIYNFVHPARAWGDAQPHSSLDVRVQRLWHTLNAQGLTTHVVDVPLTFPPEPVQGLMVSDLMVAGQQQARTFPPELRDDITRAVGTDFSWAIGDGLEVSEAYLEHLARSLEQKLRLDEWLVARQAPDAFFTVYQHTDVLAHYFWHVWDPTHPAYDEGFSRRLTPALERVVRGIDQALKRLLELAGPECLVAIVSDHGFGPVRTRVHINDLLIAWGDLKVEGGERIKLELARRGLSVSRFVHLARRLDVLSLRRHLSLKSARSAVSMLSVAGVKPTLEHSNAWFSHGLDPGVTLSPEARANTAYVDGLMERLRNARPSPGAAPFFERVIRREEVYSGPALEQAPDIVLQLGEGYVATPEITGGRGSAPSLGGQITGFHRPEGVFVLAGPGVLAGKEHAAVSILDVTPTLLAGLGLPVLPASDGLRMDGRVQATLFEDGLIDETQLSAAPFEEGHPVQVLPPPTGSGAPPQEPRVFDAGEEEEIRRRLQALGYQ